MKYFVERRVEVTAKVKAYHEIYAVVQLYI